MEENEEELLEMRDKIYNEELKAFEKEKEKVLQELINFTEDKRPYFEQKRQELILWSKLLANRLMDINSKLEAIQENKSR